MSKKIDVDIDELKQAVEVFGRIESEGLLTGIINRFLSMNLSENWNSDAGKEFTGKIQEAFGDIKKVRQQCTVFRQYCNDTIKSAEASDNIIHTIFNIVKNSVGNVISTGVSLISNTISSLLSWLRF